MDSTLQANDNWFYIPGYALRPQAQLVSTYHRSVGHNSNWLLDIAPMPNGSIALDHMAGYRAVGDALRACYDFPLASAMFSPPHEGQVNFTLTPGGAIDRIRLREDLEYGHIVRAYTVWGCTAAGPPCTAHVVNGTAIGNTKIDLLGPAQSWASLLVTTDAVPTGLAIDVFNCPGL